MAAPLSSAIENYVKGFDESCIPEISNNLTSRDVKLVELTEQLGAFLTNTDTNIRARATRLLAEVLNKLPPTFLSEKEGEFLTVYLCDRLQDHHSLQPHALFGLLALSQSVNLPSGSAETICRTIFRDVHNQSLPHGDRRSVFNIFINLLNTKMTELQGLGADFVYGYIQAMDAEKDPRNLVLAFSCARTIILNFPLGVFVEEMFEVISCYFPVDFTPSGNDPSGIKKEDLVLGLRRCLTATPKFAEYCLPLLMEKLTSDLKSAKLDALQTLTACTETYGADALLEFQSSFFNCIKKEVFVSGETDLEMASLEALRALVKTLSAGVAESGTRKNLDGFLEEIMTECKQHLLQPELMLMLSTGRLLQAVAMASDSACCQILGFSIPLLLESHGRKPEHTPRHNVLEALTGLVNCTSQFHYSDDTPNPVTGYREHLLLLYAGSLSDCIPSIQRQGALGYQTLLTLGVLSTADKVKIARELTDKILSPATESEIRNVCNAALKVLSTTSPEIVQSDVLPQLFSCLKTVAMETNSKEVSAIVDKTCVFECLSSISVHSVIVQDVTQELVARLRVLLATEDAVEESQVTSHCLSCIAERCKGDNPCCHILYTVAVPAVYNMAVTFSQGSRETTLMDPNVLKNMAATIRHIATQLGESDLETLQKEVVRLYVDGDTAHFSPDDHQLVMKPFQTDNVRQQKLIELLTPVVCSGPRQAIVDDQLLSRVWCLIRDNKDTTSLPPCVYRCLAGLINRHATDSRLQEILGEIQTHFSTILVSGANQDGCRQGLECWAWITKALVLRNHQLANSFVDKLLQMLTSPDMGVWAADGMAVIVTEYQDVMTKAMGASLRLMYRQRFFQENLPKLVDGFNQAQPACRKNYLLTVSYLLKNLSKQVLFPHLSQLFPLLIHSLLCDDVTLQLSTMMTFGDLTQDAPDLVAKQIDALIPQLLKLTKHLPSMKVRMAALRCVKQLTVLPIHVIIPYRGQVVRALLPALDDKKRLVRNEAVSARMDWYLLDTKKE